MAPSVPSPWSMAYAQGEGWVVLAFGKGIFRKIWIATEAAVRTELSTRIFIRQSTGSLYSYFMPSSRLRVCVLLLHVRTTRIIGLQRSTICCPTLLINMLPTVDGGKILW